MHVFNRLAVFCGLLLSCALAAAQCAPCTIWTPGSSPAIVDSGDASSVELGLKFRSDVAGYVTGVRYYKSAGNSGTHIANLWSASGSLLATAQFSGESNSGWQQVTFSAPVLISSGTTYIVSYFAPTGHYSFDANVFATSAVDAVPLHALASGVDGSNGVYNYGSTSTFPTSSFNSSNYWVDVVFVPSGSTAAPAVTSTSPANAAGGVATNISVTATFSEPMDPASITATSFQLLDANQTAVAGTVTYNSANAALVFQPSTPLANGMSFAATVRGSVTDVFGNVMGSDFNWSFATQKALPPGLCPCSIFNPNVTPGVVDSGEARPVELGVKFQSDLGGYITGVRFYKSAANAGTHVGNLWTGNGVLLATATFTAETASGWQQVTFSSPVAISSGTTYVASYYTSTGHYAFDQSEFATAIDNSPLHGLASASSGGNGVYEYNSTSIFPSSTYNASNYWVDVAFTPSSSSVPPLVTATTPGDRATNVPLASAISARFSEPMNAATITSSNFQMVDSLGNVVPGAVSYVSNAATLMFQPTTTLTPQTTYTATVRGTVTDVFGNSMGADYSWSFVTAPPPPDSGPGGPILVIANAANPFTRYYSEILLNEGLNEFLIKDISTITPAVLSQYDVAILGDMSLTPTQVSTLSSWVNAGGNLIAMHPDQQLAATLGLTPLGTTLSDAYLLVNAATAPGFGIVAQTIQYHGPADLYSLNGARAVAMLYSDASTSTTSPAVTVNNVGAGHASAFTYDLAKAVMLLRQGNPAWSGQDRDGFVDPATGLTEIRSNDLFFGDASFDPQPDWVNLSKVQIPQADEQQRLLTNMIQFMNLSRKPLPRFWYLPKGYKAAVVMTGDDHFNDRTSARFDIYINQSPAGCSVADWTCVRATSYVWPNSFVVANYQSYVSQGFEIANHTDSSPSCTTFTPDSLEAAISGQLAAMAANYPGMASSKTNRTHCVLWSDFDSEPTILLRHGIRLDTSYYYWPDMWVQGRPGLFTGSGLPMRFADRNGNTIDVYQATTQFPDETTWNFPADIDTVLDNAVGPLGYYAVITPNMHTDFAQSDGSDSIVAEAQARGVPVIAAQQMLTWLDGRNNSKLGSIAWSTNTLTFTVTAASGARNLEVMIPVASASGTLSAITLAGVPVNYSLLTVKGLQYAAFLTTGGNYQAVYGGSSHSLSGTISGTGGSGATVKLTGTATATTTADGSGNYSFPGLPDGPYTVAPTNTGFTFSPGTKAVTISGADVTGVSFTSAVITYTISGTINGAGGNGATVILGGAASASTTANASGAYSFSGLANGAYTVTPSKAGFTFTPASQGVTVSGANVIANFGTLTFSISGTISGAGGNGAAVSLAGASSATTTANALGSYSFSGLANGSYAVTPSKSGFTFTPASQNVTVNGANVTANFATVSYTISGTISGAGGNGATVTLTGAATVTATASSTGIYVFSGRTNGAYTVTPRKTGYTFSPTNQAVTVNNANVSGVNFSSTAVPVLQLSPTSINFGTVRDFTTSAISTVTVRNIGGTTMSNISIAVTGTNAAEFAVASNTCGTTLAASASCTVSLQLTPQSPGARTASLTVTSNAANNPQSVALTGTGTMVSLSASSISFGSQTVRTTSLASTITMTNVGPGSLTITGITITGTNAGNFSQTNTCGTALAANANCTISVRFTPSARGSRSASLRIADSDPTSPQLVALSGTGL
jgi:hypothetical protein